MIATMPAVKAAVVDVHAHLGPYSLFFTPAPDADRMVVVMDRTGTGVAVVASNRAIQQDAHRGNSETLLAVDAHPRRLAGYAVINPWQNPQRELERLADEDRFVGIKIHPTLHRYPVTGSRYADVWSFAQQTGCPVLSHTDQRSDVDAPALFDTIAASHPDARIIMGHAGNTPDGMDAAVAVATRHPNVNLEVCGSEMTGELIADAVARIGGERILFGSDFPFIDQRMSLGRVLYAPLTEPERRDILCDNARRLFTWRPLPSEPEVLR